MPKLPQVNRSILMTVFNLKCHSSPIFCLHWIFVNKLVNSSELIKSHQQLENFVTPLWLNTFNTRVMGFDVLFFALCRFWYLNSSSKLCLAMFIERRVRLELQLLIPSSSKLLTTNVNLKHFKTTEEQRKFQSRKPRCCFMLENSSATVWYIDV